MTQALAVEPQGIKISQYEALTSDIEIAKQNAVKSFDYEGQKGDKAARSYIAGLRKIRSRIESVRKEAKSYALEYGRAVDAQAKALEAQILGLIEPHQQALDAIAQREKDRVAKHKATLQEITATIQGASAEGVSAETIALSVSWLENARKAEPSLEEFQDAADAEIANGLRLLNALHAAALEREKREALEAAEAQRLAEEEEARRKAEQEARKAEQEARQAEAVERARQEAAAKAARAVAEAEQRAKESEVRAAVAEQRRKEQEAAIQEEREATERRRIEEERRRIEAQEEAEQAARDAQVQLRDKFAMHLSAALAGKTRAQIVQAIMDGSLHPAVTIVWGKV